MTERLLSSTQAERFYNRFGKRLDSQTFYEAPALNDLAAHLELGTCRAVVEFGCRTGRFAEELFEGRLPPEAIYVGRDISKVMVRIARERLARYGARATVEKTDGGARIDRPDGAFDRFICTFVLDLLPDAEARAVMNEAKRLLTPGGLAGLVSLTNGKTPISRAITTIWNGLRLTGSVPHIGRRIPPDRNPCSAPHSRLDGRIPKHRYALRRPVRDRGRKEGGRALSGAGAAVRCGLNLNKTPLHAAQAA